MSRPPQIRSYSELVIDCFAGGGGASTGIEMALGRSPDIAINHDAEAVRLHARNHPQTKHYVEDVFDVDPVKVCGGRRVALAWFSPDCTFHSKARGGKPFRDRNRARRRRGLAGVVIRWANAVHPRVIFLENVEEFQDWGPLTDDGRPDPARRGFSYRRWLAQLESAGYSIETRILRACDFGAPTTRRRLFLIARCDGRPIVWPMPTHGPGRPLPYRTAAECIDWSIPCPSIFERKKPLAEKTMARIARGIFKFVIHSGAPFIVPVTHGRVGDSKPAGIDEPLRTVTGANRGELALVAPFVAPAKSWGGGGNDARSLEEPARTTTASKRGEHALVSAFLAPATHGDSGGRPDRRVDSVEDPARTLTTLGVPRPADEPMSTTLTGKYLVSPSLVQTGYGERTGQAPRTLDIHAPLGTVVGDQKHGLVAAFLAKHNGGHEGSGVSLEGPVDTVTTRDHHALATAFCTRFYGTGTGSALDEPLKTVTAGGGKGGGHFGEVRAFLTKYYGQGTGQRVDAPAPTVTSHAEHIGLVTVQGELFAIADIGMRMLQPRELFRAQGFSDAYVIDSDGDGRAFTKTVQVRLCGNSVCPPIAAALVRANVVIDEMAVA